jgi:thiol-disulfide isomerase/thioredoxin
MIDRIAFLKSTLALMATVASPVPTATSSANPWDLCLESPSLPYDKPIDLKMAALDAPDFHLLDYRGKAVILNVFASWCGPCNVEQPFLVDIAARYADQGLAIVGINDRETDNVVRTYRTKYGIKYPLAMDRKGVFTYSMQVGSGGAERYLPTLVFITPDGYLYCYLNGDVGKDELEYRVKRFLAETPPTKKS